MSTANAGFVLVRLQLRLVEEVVEDAAIRIHGGRAVLVSGHEYELRICRSRMYLTLLCQNIDCRFQGRRCSISSLSHQCHDQVFGIVFHFDIAVADAEQFRLGAAEWPSHHNENITLAILQIPGGLGSVGRFPSEFPMPLFAPPRPTPTLR